MALSPPTADSAVTAARAALWTWSAGDGAISIRAEAGSALAALDGRWRLDSFLAQVDGLVRATLGMLLRDGEAGGRVDVRLTLNDGVPVHFVGSFHDAGVARGLIISTEADTRFVYRESNVEPVFQAIRSLDDLSVVGFEALARFRSPDGQLVGPETLVGLGGDTDWSAIAPVMLLKSARVLAELRAAGHDVFMQVNLSAAEIARPILVEEIATIVRDAKLPHGALRIELTEQAAMRDFEGALGALAAFRAAGAGVVLDDFGAGHSSFAWLAELPADGVKLDPKLSTMVTHPRAARIVSALTGLIRSLGMTVTAEGIEDAALAADLHAIGCNYVQGFAWDLPLRAQDIGVAFDPLSARLARPA